MSTAPEALLELARATIDATQYQPGVDAGDQGAS
jgi:hypothetical protein